MAAARRTVKGAIKVEAAGILEMAGWWVTIEPFENAWVKGVPLWFAKDWACAVEIRSATWPTASVPRGDCIKPLEPFGSGDKAAIGPDDGASGPRGE